MYQKNTNAIFVLMLVVSTSSVFAGKTHRQERLAQSEADKKAHAAKIIEENRLANLARKQEKAQQLAALAQEYSNYDSMAEYGSQPDPEEATGISHWLGNKIKSLLAFVATPSSLYEVEDDLYAGRVVPEITPAMLQAQRARLKSVNSNNVEVVPAVVPVNVDNQLALIPYVAPRDNSSTNLVIEVGRMILARLQAVQEFEILRQLAPHYNRRHITPAMLDAQRAQLNRVNLDNVVIAPAVAQVPSYEGVAELFVEPVAHLADRAIDPIVSPEFKITRKMQYMYGAAAFAILAGAYRYGPTIATAVKVKANALSKAARVEYIKAKLVLGHKIDVIKAKYKKAPKAA